MRVCMVEESQLDAGIIPSNIVIYHMYLIG